MIKLNRYSPLTMAALLCAAPLTAWSSGGHYPVDDADITPPGEVQIESWFSRIDAANHELAVLLATTPRNTRLELTAGLYQLREDRDSELRFEPAAKWRFTADDDADWMIAASFAVGYEDDRVSDWLLNLPVSYAMPNRDVIVHGNLGWIHERSAGRSGNDVNRAFFGAGIEWAFTDSMALIGQWYREGAEAEPEAQLGLRWSPDATFEAVDLAVGRVLRGDDKDWTLTLGFTLTF